MLGKKNKQNASPPGKPELLLLKHIQGVYVLWVPHPIPRPRTAAGEIGSLPLHAMLEMSTSNIGDS